MSPKSSSETLMSRSAVARTVPSSTGTSYVLPVRLSVIVRESEAVATPPPFVLCSSVDMRLRSKFRDSLPAMMTGATYRPGWTARRGSAGEHGGRHRGGHEQDRQAHDATRQA